MIMKEKIGFNDIRRVIMFNLLLINAASFHMLCLAVMCLLYASWFFLLFFFLMCVHIPPHSFIFILTIYTAFSPLGFLHTWSRHTIVYTQLEFLIRP